MAILAVDFDGVLHDHLHPLPGKILGEPLPGAVNAVRLLRQEANHKIIIYSVKPPDIIEDWMRFYDIPFDRITTLKPSADIYIDDKGFRHNNWDETLNAFRVNGLLPNGL